MEPAIKIQLRHEIVAASLGVAHAQAWNEGHPEDPHGGDQFDLALDTLNEALDRWAEKPWK